MPERHRIHATGPDDTTAQIGLTGTPTVAAAMCALLVAAGYTITSHQRATPAEETSAEGAGRG